MLSRFLTNLTSKTVLIVCISAALLAGGAASFVTQTATVAPPTKTSKPVKLQIEGRALKFNQAVRLTSTRLEQTSTQPLTLATADFDEDGTPDLLSGAVNAGVGFVSYYRGNVAAIYPQARLDETVPPFFSASHFVNLPAPPDFLVTGDFNADGHTDVIAAARGGSAIYLLAGDGKGGLAEAVTLELDGEVTALSAGEFNHADGLTDMAVALTTRVGGQVLLFSDAKGAWLTQPLSFDFAQAPTAMEFGQLTPDSLADLAVAAGNQMVILDGNQASPRMTRTQLTSAVVSLTVGRFTDQTHDQVALLAQDGSLSIATHSRPNVRRQSNRLHSSSEWQVARIFSNSDERPTTRATRQLMHGRISGGAFDDLLTLQGNQLQCVTIQNNPQNATVALEGTDDLVTALPLRMSSSPLQGVVFLRQNESAPLIVQPEAALTFTVNSTRDEHDLRPGDGICTTTATGAPLCTLRAAIEEANANPGADTINFNIGPGTQIIYLSSLLFITEALTIDGSPLAPAPATQSIVVNGERIPGGVPGSVALFTVTRGNTVIRGLTISAVSKINGISLTGGSQSFIEGNTIRDTYYAIGIVDSARNTIGGTSPAARNVIAGNSYGIFVQGGLASNNRILGNYIGTDATGTRTVGNRVGIFLSLAPLNTIGGTTATARNVISGNLYEGIFIDGNPRSSSLSEGADRNTIQGNYIGTDVTGKGALGNGWGLVSAAVSIDGASNTTIGGAAPGAGNVIANNYREGIWVLPLRTSTGRIPLNNAIQGNSIYNNGTLGIDLDAPGVTANDPGDGDSGANNLQNFPIITSAITRTTGTTITGTLNSKPNSSYVVEIFANRECDPSGNGEGETFVTRVGVTTDNTGNETFTTVLETPIPNGQILTATATDANGNTSEFSPCRVVRAATVDLSITKTASPATVIVTQPLTYTITVSNAVGADPATGVVVTDVLPAGLSFSSATTSQGTCSTPAVGANGTVTCALGTITPTNTATITLRVILTGVTGGALSNTATVGSNETDSISTNNSATQTTTVSKADTTVALASSPNPAGLEQPVTFTATVAAVPPGIGTPTGEVMFVEGETTLGTAVVTANGQASFTTANLALGRHSIVAKYGGDASFNPSTSPILVQEIVTKANTSVTLTSSANPAGLGQALTFTAVVTAAGGIPTGTVTFVDGETTLGSALVNANGQATLTTANLTLGNHPIVAQYSGDTNFNPSTSAVLVQVINTKAIATVVLTSSVNPASLGQAVTFTATVTGGPGLPIGVVTFVDGNMPLGSSTLNANGQATFTTSSLVLGEHTIVAQYSGDALFNPSTSAVLVQVVNNKASTSVELTSSSNPASLGQAVTFTATVTGGAGLPTGVVTFVDGTTTLGTVALNNRGQAIFTTSSLTVGSHPIVAQYGGDANFNGSTSAVLTQVINTKARATVTLTTSANPASLGQAVTFTATVTATAGGIPTGSVTFVDGSTTLGSSVLNANGQATFTTSSLALGSHPIVAQYSGDTNVNPSTSAVLTQVINSKASTGVVLLSSENPAGVGQAVTFTAIVTASAPSTGLPSGRVTFVDGETILGTVSLPASGQATLTTSSLSLGTHVLVAQYGGDANFNGSTSAVLTQIINNKAKTAVALNSSANPAGLGQAVTLTATVTGVAPGTGTPSGTVTFVEGTTTLGSAPVNANGQATITLATLALGEHPIVAQYSGDTNFNPSMSAVLTQVINSKAESAVTLSSSANPASLGQAITLTATVTGVVGRPTGQVTFVEGTTTLGSAVVNANGQATLTLATLALGEHLIVAQYSGDILFNGSTSAPLTQVINTKASASVALTSSVNPASLGQAITLTATVVASSGTPSGTVTFVDGTTTLGSSALTANGQATFTTSSLALGEHPIVAQYSGDANVNPSTSAVLTQVINSKASTSVVLSSSENPAGVGQPVTFTAVVTAAAGSPTGQVTFREGTTTLGSAAVNASGQAMFTTSSLGLGDHPIVAQYSGDENFNPSTSAVLVQTINTKASASITLTSSANPASVGQAVTFTATVTGVNGLPTGVVTFVDGTTTLGSSALNANGQATFTTSSLVLGNHSIVAQYGGDVLFNPSTSAVLVQVINSKASTSVVLTSSVNPAGIGQAVTFTASVAGAGGTPGGTVTFREGESTLGSATVNANGQASLTTTSLALGEHPIVAQYGGDANFNPSTSAVLVQVVNSKTSTNVTLTSSANPTSLGQAITLIATVAANIGTPSGTVTFVDGTTTLGIAVVNANGQATLTTSSLALGSHPIVAQYGGDANFNPSTSVVLTQVINTKAGSAVALSSSPNPASVGQAVTFTATVTALTAGTAPPTGSVTLVDGNTTLGSVVLNANGVASFTVSSLTVGTHSIVAEYAGDTTFNPSASNTLLQVINNKGVTSVALSSSANPAGVGQAVTFTASVGALTSGLGTPTGSVNFVEGATVLGSAPVNGLGQATFTTTTLSLGSHVIVAQYGGDTNFNGSVSAQLTQIINTKLGATVNLTSSQNPASLGQAITFTATVAGGTAGTATPTGLVTFVDGETAIGSAALNANGQASLTTTSLGLGNHPILARYNGDDTFNGSTSAILVQVINTKASTTVALSSSSNPASLGQSVTFTASVVAGGGTPSGVVTFVDGTTTLGSASINTNGQATFTTSSLTLGTHPIVAQYGGDANFNGSTSAVLTQVINTKASASVAITSSANPASLGQAVTFTATVIGVAGLPSGTVTFVDGTTTLGSSALNANGQATFTTSSLTLGEHPIVAQYSGDALFNPSTSAVLVQVVNTKASANVTLTSSQNPASLGQAITLTATVVASSGTPSGTVMFVDGATTLGTVTLTASGQATLTTAGLALGNHSIVAQYSGDTNVNPSVSAALVQVINTKTSATVVLTSSPNPASLGQAVTFTATVTGGAGLPVGMVTFVEGNITLGSSVLNANGQATFTTSSLTLGEHPIVAQYGGDVLFNPSTSAVLVQVINNKVSTSVTLTSSVNPAGVGQAVTFTATVTASAPGTGIPSGTVAFMDGVTTLGTVTLPANGQATLTTSSLSVGTHVLVAQYGGDANFNPSTSPPLTQGIIVKSETSVTLTSSANPASLGQAVTLTAMVRGSTGTPNGTVTFVEGATTLGSVTVTANGEARFTTTSLSLGSHEIVAQYSGDALFNPSASAVLIQVINTKAGTAVPLSSSANPASLGQAVTFTATVAVVAPGTGMPSGSVTFSDGATTLGSAVVNGNGQATLTLAILALGEHPIVAQYGGDANFNPSTSAVLVQIVNTKINTSVTLTSSANPASLGQAVTFTATVTAATGLPTGVVTFVEGTTTLGSALVNANGQATFTTSSLALGEHAIVAQYSGDVLFNPSTSAVLVQVVNTKVSTSVTLTSSVNPASLGQAVTFTATVTAGSGTPSGMVTFVDGSTTLGSSVLNANGQATFTTSSLVLGNHPMVAQYGGDVNFNGSNSAVLVQIVNTKPSTSVTLTSSANPASLGQAVTFTATVTAGSGTPSGSVTFVDGNNALGSSVLNANGQATFTTSSLALGEHPIVGQYSGDANVNPSVSAVLVQIINTKASTNVVLSSSENPASVGQAVTFTAVVTAATGSPTGVMTFREGETTLGSAIVNASGQATFTTSSLTLGNHPIIAQYGGDANFNPSTSAVLVQVINTKPSISVSLTSSANPASLGQAVTFTASVTAIAGGTPTGVVTFVEGSTPLGTGTLNANGQATFTTSSLTLGEHPIVAQYSGDANFNPRLSAVLVQVINGKASTTLTLRSSANPASVGQAVTFTATVAVVAPGTGTPSGSVTFVEGTTTLGSAAVNANGQATFTTSSLALGDHPIVAQYSGDANFNPSTSAVLVQVINSKVSTSVTLASSSNPASIGQAVIFTATVVAGSGTPSGTITFVDGATTLGTVSLSASGQASLTTASLALGSHSIVAQYNGDTNFNPSNSAVLVQTINTKVSTSVTLTSSANPASLGQAITLTATVVASSGTPSGTVMLVEGTTTLGTAALNANGVASFTVSSLTVGTHSIVAEYAGDTTFNPSASNTLLQVINNKGVTSVALSSSANPAGVGQAVTFTASVGALTSGLGTPTGSVNFVEGSTVLGSAPVNGLGQATFTTTTLALGSHVIVAQYGGDTNFNGSVSAQLTQIINTKLGATVSLTSSQNPAQLGQAVTFTATVAGGTAGAATPTGLVTFVDGETAIGSAALNANGQASITTTSPGLGDHPIVARYNGDDTFNGGTSAILVQVINTKASTTVALSSSANPASLGQVVTFTATVGAGGGTPSGVVTFVDGTTTLGSASVNANGQAIITTGSLTLGNHSIVAQYGGDANFNGSNSAVLVQVINTKNSASVVLTSSANPASLGQSVTFTATVTVATGLPTGLVTFVEGTTTLGSSALNTNGQATFTTSSLALGEHAIVVQYSGDVLFNPSTSAVLTQVINTKVSTSVTLTSSANPAGVGQAITFTARVNSATGAPTGQVTFVEGATTLGSAVVNANGQATFTTSSLGLGNHLIVAQYSGDTNFNPSVSSTLTQVINTKAGTAVTLSSSANPASLGQAVTFTATVAVVAPSTGTPSGSVTFSDGATTLGSTVVNANGQATFTTSSLTLGEHPLVAQYGGDGNFNPSTSAVLVQVINTKTSTSVTLTTSANPASLGQALTLTATVSAVAGLPTGVVTFVEGTTTLGSATVNANGQATFTTSSLTLGNHPIVAQYSGDVLFNPSTSAVLVQVVNTKTSTSIAITSSANPASLGQAVTFTATVVASSGTPSGTVTFVDGATTLGSASVNANGQAVFTTSSLLLGVHPIVAQYGGDANFNGSTSTVLVQTINTRVTTTVTLTSSVNPASLGQAITLTATVVASSGTPTGSVTFVEGTTTLGSSALNANGQATLTTSNLTVGEHPIVAQYSGDTNVNPSVSAVLVQVVNTKASTSVVLLSSENPAGVGQAVTFTAVVTAAAGLPTGQVTFREGGTTLGSATVNASGQATFTTSSLTLGDHPIEAQYGGDANFNGSTSAVLVQTINTKSRANVILTSSVNPASLGQAVTFTASVTATAGGTPTGLVTFVDGNLPLGSAAINANDQATFTTSALTLGEHPMVALYGGDANFNPRRSDTVLQEINSKASTTIVLRSLANLAGVGQAVTFTVTVAGVGGTPGGTVTFREGATTLGSSVLNANGQATFTTSSLALGEHPIVAQYGGDANFNPSNSAVLVQVVNTKPGTAVTLTSSANPASVGQAVTFTATVVVVTGSGTPSGSVTFVDGATTLGSASVNANGQATFTTSSLALGNHPIVAQYSGDANVNPSGSAVLVQVINTKASTSVTLTSSVNPASQGQAVTFTATVSATAGGTPTGVVTFVDGTTTLGSAAINANGQATFTTSSLTLGNHSVVAQYGGDANFNGNTSAVLVQVINTKASAIVTLASSANPASLGQAITLTATVVAGSGTPSGTVTFVDGTTTLGTVTLSASGQATLTTASLALGNHSIVAQYSGDTNVNPGASTALVQVVNTKVITSVVLTSSVNPAGIGQAVTFTARVSTAAGTPSGSVTFVEGTTTLGSAVVNANGQATLTTASLALGNHSIVAQYGGDANFNGSNSATLTQVINNKAGSVVSLSSSPNPANVGQAVTFTAMVTALTPGTPPPTGSVTLMDGATVLGSVALNTNGVASITVSNLAAGTHSIVAQYAGDSIFNGFTSTPLTLVINSVFSDLGLTMTASANPVLANSNVTYTIRVSNSGPDAAPSVAVSDTLPSALRITNCTATGGGVCSGQGNARVVNFPSLAAGATADITITASLGCNNSDVTLVNTATVTSLAIDRAPNNDAVTVTTVGQAGKASGTITYESGATALSLGPVVVGSSIAVPAGTGTFTLTNTGCLPMELTDAFFTRAVTATNLAGLDDSRYFTLRLVPSSGAEIALNPTPNPDRNAPQPIPIRRTVPSGGQLVFRVTFQPPVPFFAGAFEGLFANQVLPQQFDSRVIFNFVTGSTSPGVAEATGDQGNVTANLKASVDPKVQIVQRENEPLVSLTKTPTDFRVRVSLYDANKNATLITYQFLNNAGQPATAPIELNLATLLNSSPLLPGQCFTLQQDFSGAANRPDITGVRVTVVDADGANVSATGNLIPSLTAPLRFLEAVISPDVLVSEPLRLGDISVAVPQQSISRPTITNLRREK